MKEQETLKWQDASAAAGLFTCAAPCVCLLTPRTIDVTLSECPRLDFTWLVSHWSVLWSPWTDSLRWTFVGLPKQRCQHIYGNLPDLEAVFSIRNPRKRHAVLRRETFNIKILKSFNNIIFRHPAILIDCLVFIFIHVNVTSRKRFVGRVVVATLSYFIQFFLHP